jgi:hypothetical protein
MSNWRHETGRRLNASGPARYVPLPVVEARAIHGPSDLGVEGQPAAAMLPAVGEPPASWRGPGIRADVALPIRREDACGAPVTAERDADVQPVRPSATPAQGRFAEYGGWRQRELGKATHHLAACERGRFGMCWRKTPASAHAHAHPANKRIANRYDAGRARPRSPVQCARGCRDRLLRHERHPA